MGVYRKKNGVLQSVAGAIAGGLPIGTIATFQGEGAPQGWLKCDGSTFDREEYPALYLLLGSDTLPDITTSEEEVIWTGTNGSNGTITLDKCLWDYARVRFEGGHPSNPYKCPSSTWERDQLLEAKAGGTQRLFMSWYGTEHQYYTPSENGYVITGANGSGSWNAIKRIVGIGKDHQYIKALTGLDEQITDYLYNNVINYIESQVPLYEYDADTNELNITMRQ